MDELSKGVNLIIGSNGNGKSNFLDSIIYVLTDKYQNMRQEDKKLLLHEDITDKSEDSAKLSVELVIDNKSHRFPIEKDQISIMKLFDTKEGKEEIVINQKRLLKSDVQNLLEGAGFMKTNPYYIIQQGKINQILNCTDEEYFDIFCDAMGTKIYEEKKAESLKLLEENKSTRAKIEMQANEIQNHIDKLYEQCEDLKNYSKVELKRRGIEYFILNEQINDLEKNIGFLQEKHQADINQIKDVYQKQNLTKNEINQKLKEIEKLNEYLDSLHKKVSKFNKIIGQIESNKIQKESNLSTKNYDKKETEKQLAIYQNELNNLLAQKNYSIKELSNAKKGIEVLENDLIAQKKEFNELKGKSNYLLIKNPKERKAYLVTELKNLKESKSVVDDSIININKEISKEKEDIDDIISKMKSLENDINEQKSSIENINNNLASLKDKRRNYTNLIKKDMIDINEFSDQMTQLKNQMEQLSINFPNFEIFKTVSALKNMRIQGFYGLVLDLIDANPKVRNAIDLILKDRLYTIIVDTMETAKRILDENKKINGPVINIIPLDFIELNGDDTADSEDEDSEWIMEDSQNNKSMIRRKDMTKTQLAGAKSFLDFIKINDEFIKQNPTVNQKKLEKILDDYFGKCQIVKDYETGMKYAKIYHFTCVTSANEVIYGGGYLTHMGHFDYNKQRISLYNKLSEINKRYNDFDEKKGRVNEHKEQIMNQEMQIQQETDTSFKNRSDINSKLDALEKEMTNCLQNKTSSEQRLNHYQDEFNKLLLQQKEYESKIKVYNDILNGNVDINKNIINTQTVEQIDELEKRIMEREKKKNELIEKCISYEERINHEIPNKEIELQNKINSFQNILNNIDSSFSYSTASTQEISVDEHEINIYKENIKKYMEEISTSEQKINDNQTKLAQLNEVNNKLSTQVNKLEYEINEIKLSLNDKNNKKSESAKKLEQLSGFDHDIVKKLAEQKAKFFKNSNESGINIKEQRLNQEKMLQKVYEELNKVNKELQKYDKVNRFAKDDLQEFIDKKNSIKEKLEDLDEKVKTIYSFIENIDNKNNEAIQDTFENVKKSFSKFFKYLTGNGKGNMELSQDKRSIHISVSFNEEQNSSQTMYQLSGGQKTAAGVALIFALSTIEPPPFYILDEIDAALDPNYRINLANLIKELSKNNQFIISTFKPELIDVADNIYMVKFANKTSNIIKIEKDEAHKFIES
jgi:structural maintenance of chromosome 3 (chondroitin sulfate proteoglycan 6)